MTMVADAYRISGTRDTPQSPARRDVRIVARDYDDKGVPTSWAVFDCGTVMCHDGSWEYEPPPSSRDAEFLARARLSDAFEAFRVFRATQ